MSRIGASSFITPREIIRDFLAVLDILFQNPEAVFGDILKKEEKNFIKSSEKSFSAAKSEDGVIENDDGPDDNENVQKAFEVKFEDIEI